MFYNFPLFTENCLLKSTLVASTLPNSSDEEQYLTRINHRLSELVVKDYWKLLGNNLNIQDALRL